MGIQLVQLKKLDDYYKEYLRLVHFGSSESVDRGLNILFKDLRKSGLILKFKKTIFNVQDFGQADQNLILRIGDEFKKRSIAVNISEEMEWIDNIIANEKTSSDESTLNYSGVYQAFLPILHYYYALRFFPDGKVLFRVTKIPAPYSTELVTEVDAQTVSSRYKCKGNLIEFKIEIKEINYKLDFIGKISADKLYLNVFNNQFRVFYKTIFEFKRYPFKDAISETDPNPQNNNMQEMIISHAQKFFGNRFGILAESIPIPNYAPELNMYVFGPNSADDRNYWTILTVGTSSTPMNIPEGYEHLQHTEIVIKLPMKWNFNMIDPLIGAPIFPDLPLPDDSSNSRDGFLPKKMTEPEYFWPIKWLNYIARVPYMEKNWVGFGHKLPGDQQSIFPYWILKNLSGKDENFNVLNVGSKKVFFYVAIPIYLKELEFVRVYGVEELLLKFEAEGIDDVINPDRKCVISTI